MHNEIMIQESTRTNRNYRMGTCAFLNQSVYDTDGGYHSECLVVIQTPHNFSFAVYFEKLRTVCFIGIMTMSLPIADVKVPVGAFA